MRIDPRTDAARSDLADVRLADRVFAPHYAAPVPHVVIGAVPLRAAKQADAEVIAQLGEGDLFEVLELSAGNAWGRAPGIGLVGYVDAALLKAQA